MTVRLRYSYDTIWLLVRYDQKVNIFSADLKKMLLICLIVFQQKYIRAYEVFDTIKDECYPALYQLAVILYDDLLNRVSLN